MIDPFAEIGFRIAYFWWELVNWFLELFGLIPADHEGLQNFIFWFLIAFTFVLWHWYVKAIVRFGEEVYYLYKKRW